MVLTNLRRFGRFHHRLRYFSSGPQPPVPHIAIVGSGPGGFYTAKHILSKLGSDVKVHIFEKDPIPFGLVRYGVAPDHPEVKNVINTFTQVANNPNCDFFGNIEVGKDILIKDLRRCYSAVILAYGCSQDKRLNIPGENLKNVLSASSVINWYNGYPDFQNLELNLETKSCVILGHGNVAIDVARILLSPSSLLEKTDISENALKQLLESKIEKVFMVGRRGPLQASFTPAELREMTKLPGCRLAFKKQDFVDLNIEEDVPRNKKRLMVLQKNLALEGTSDEDKERWMKATRELRYVFKRSPLRFLTDDNSPDVVSAVEFSVNNLENLSEKARAIPTDKKEIIKAGLVIKSIGYCGKKIDAELPFDEKTKIVPNLDGRVIDHQGLYCSGWIKTGPVGVILSTMNSAFETGKIVVQDLKSGVLKVSDDVSIHRNDFLKRIKDKYVSFSDWQKLDEIEVRRGQAVGKSRQKVMEREEMLKLMRS